MSEILLKTMSDSSYQTADSSVFEAVLASDGRNQEFFNIQTIMRFRDRIRSVQSYTSLATCRGHSGGGRRTVPPPLFVAFMQNGGKKQFHDNSEKPVKGANRRPTSPLRLSVKVNSVRDRQSVGGASVRVRQ